jgi:hypothetical protein
MSLSSTLLPIPSIEPNLARFVAQRAALLERIEKLEKANTLAGHEKETDAAKLLNVKAKRLASYRSTLATIEANIVKATAENAAIPVTYQPQPEQVIASAAQTPGKPAAVISGSSRRWYHQFETTSILPAFAKLTLKETGEKTKVDDAEAREEFLRLANEILLHYKSLQQDTKNLENYIEGINIIAGELLTIKKSMFGYLKLIKMLPSMLKGGADQLAGEFGRALKAITKNNPLEPGKKTKPIFIVNCEAERDFVLLTNRFLHFFILSRDSEITYKDKTINMALSMDALIKIILKNATKFEYRVVNYEAAQQERASSAALALEQATPLANQSQVHVSSNNVTAPVNTAPSQTPAPTQPIMQPIIVAPSTNQTPIASNTAQATATSSTNMVRTDVTTIPVRSRTPDITTHLEAIRPSVVSPPLAAQPEPEQPLSFFQRHKKKILWGLGIGLVVGACIATAGVLAIVFSGVVATAAAVVGATSILKAVGFGAAIAAAGGAIGAGIGAAKGAVSDCRPTPSAASPIVVQYAPITDGWDAGRIARQVGMPITGGHQNAEASQQPRAPITLPQSTSPQHDFDYQAVPGPSLVSPSRMRQ